MQEGSSKLADEAKEIYEEGKRLFFKKKFLDAKKAFQRALHRDPYLEQINHYLGMANLKLGCIKEAIEVFAAALENEPTESNYYDLWNAYMEDSDFLAGSYTASTAVEEFPESEELHYAMGLSFQQLGSQGLAQSWYYKALAINEWHIPSLTNLGIICASQGNYLDAAGFFERALKIEPTNPGLLENVLSCCIKLGNAKRYKEIAGRLLLVCPESQFIRSTNRIYPSKDESWTNIFEF